MTYVITQNCCNDAACVSSCPVNCIHPTPDEPDYKTAEMLYIDPDSCIDCGACVEVCPVDAISADYALPEQFLRYEELNALYYRDPAHQDYPSIPEPTPKRRLDDAPDGPLRVAIVGSGPAAAYAAAELLEQRGLDVTVDMFERLHTPWGLVRSGVAPDHPGTKATAGEFVGTARRAGMRLFFDVEVGSTITHHDLAARYHAVVYAVGASQDRPLGIPGEHLPGSHSAAEFVAWYNGHPDYADRVFDFSSERAVVVGNGNVAMDVARMLLRDVDALHRTDIADHALEQLAQSKICEVQIVGRRGPAQAAFTTPELLGLSEVKGLDIVVHPDEVKLDDATLASLGDPHQSLQHFKATLIAELGSRPPTSERRAVLRFLASPTEIVGSDRVESVRLARTELVAGEAGTVQAKTTGEIEDVECGLVLRAVGYRGTPIDGLPFDEQRGVFPNDHGRLLDQGTHTVLQGVYATGWIKRGPSGVIGTNKECAKQTIDSLVDDWVAGRLTTPSDDSDITGIIPDALGLEAWKAIDDHELAAGKAASRPRVKIVDRETFVSVIRATPRS